ncbi:unnamed protein product [Adineta ricciae]|uniref:Uncharacterized protein n=1 Tax=Adineta ricciae TaxID=249248 RepID=A0A814LRD4_ADIRI|nr:unnamed protein product [Adineta ricciae]
MSSRRESVISSHLLNLPNRSRSSSMTRRRSSATDFQEAKQTKVHTPEKILIVNGKCSKVFKSIIEDCVEDCIIEFPGENSVYVSKPGHGVSIPTGSRQVTSNHPREHSFHHHLPMKSFHRKSSTQQPTGIRVSQTSNISLATTAFSILSAVRMRYPSIQSRFSLAENISEETSDVPTANPTVRCDSVQSPLLREETISHQSNFDVFSRVSSPAHRKIPFTSAYKSSRSRKKDYLLSDLVMLGPEYFAHEFNLPRTSRYRTATSAKQPLRSEENRNKTVEKYEEFEQIKQDLFHRYLWTQNPQVACRIRPLPTYKRSATSII